MNSLKNNIDHYMQINGIKKYSDLLRKIAYELNYRGEEAYTFAYKEKNNFSKTLKGERPLKHEYIKPLEKIFGVPLARITEEDAYKLPIDRNLLQYEKGLRYYAYVDSPELYTKELSKLTGRDGKSILNNTDEYGNSFLDYIVKYRSINGVKYLYEEFGIKVKWFHNQFEFSKEKGSIWIYFDNAVEFARLVASTGDVELFNNIYDSYNMFYSNGHYATDSCIFNMPDYLEIILDNDVLFSSIFVERKYIQELGHAGKRIHNKDAIVHYSFNPIINNCLRHALKHLDKYKNRAEEMLQFGINHNIKVLNEYGANRCYTSGDLGTVNVLVDNKFIQLDEPFIFVDVKEIADNEIRDLIDKLPTIQNY